MPKELTKQIVLNWLSMISGPFQLSDICREHGIVSESGKSSLRVYMWRLAQDGVIEPIKNHDGMYRPIESHVEEIDWQAADITNVVPVKFPFAIHEVAKLFPRSIVVVAGAKNQGKTEFIYSFVHMNMDKFEIDLFNSETGPEQMKLRLSTFNPPIPNPAPFKSYSRYDNFADVIQPDHVAAIDYMDFNSEVYEVGTEIDRIFRKLTKGIAVIGLQKPTAQKQLYKGETRTIPRDLGYGGAFSAKRAVLYISLDAHVCKLIYVKNPTNPRINPANMQWTYEFDEEGHFKNIQRKYGD